MKNVFIVNDIPGTDQYLHVHFNDQGRCKMAERFSQETGWLETVEFHVNGELYKIVGRQRPTEFFPPTQIFPMTQMKFVPQFRLT